MRRRDKFIRFAIRVWAKCIEHQVGAYAAQSAFFILLSAIPFVVIILQVIHVLPYTSRDVILILADVLPDYMVPAVTSIIREMYTQSFGVLGITVIAAFWASSKAMHSITYGLERISTAEGNRNWFIIRFWSLLYTAFMAASLIFLLAITVFWKSIRNQVLSLFFDDSAKIYMFNSWSKWVIILLIMIFMFALMYKTFPKQKMKFSEQLPGAVFAAVGWFAASLIITLYVNYFDGFSMYGSLSTLVLLMFWLYICMYLLMIGAEINEELRHPEGL